MLKDTNDLVIEHLDELTYIIYLEVPGSKIVLFQAFFELHEGIGTVRTLNVQKSLVSVLTPTDMLSDCLALLNSIKAEIFWRPVSAPSEAERLHYLGYQKGSKTNCEG